MSRWLRLAVFAVGAGGLGLLLLWGVLDLPPFGSYAGPYGDVIAKLVEPQRHMANAVTAVVFDYRSVDTMGEELILFAAASAVALILRERREHDTEGIVDAVRSDALRGVGALTAVAAFVLGLYVVAHGFVSPGGGFQGGVVLAAPLALVFLTIEYHAFARLARTSVGETLESLGIAAFVVLGLVSFAFGLPFLGNFLDLGVTGRIRSGGSAALLNWASAFAVAGGLLLVFAEYLEENMGERYGRRTP